MIENKCPLVLISGLAADSGVFQRQVQAFRNTVPVEWLDVQPRETLEDYAKRLAASIAEQIGDGTPCYVAGLSLGGILAPMVAQYLNPKAVILIATIRKPSEFPKRYRKFYGLCRYMPRVVACGHFLLKPLLWTSLPLVRRFRSPERVIILQQVIGCRSWLFAQQLRMLFTWTLDPNSWQRDYNNDVRKRCDCPVYHIHGDRDRVLNCSNTTPDVVIHGRHVLTLYQANEVNQFVAEIIEKTESHEQ